MANPNKNLLIPSPKSSKELQKLNTNIRLFNMDVSTWEKRFMDLTAIATRAAESDVALRAHLESSNLFATLPSLRIRECQPNNSTSKDKTIRDPRTGLEYLLDSDNGILLYLKEKLLPLRDLAPIELPTGSESIERVELMLIRAKLEDSTMCSLSLRKAFELGSWILAAKDHYLKEEKEQTGMPFRRWISEKIGYSHAHISRLQTFVLELREYQRILECSIPLNFVFSHLKRIVGAVKRNEFAGDFWRTG